MSFKKNFENNYLYFSGGYTQWNYEDKTSIGYCPYIPFMFAFGLLMLFWIGVCISLISCLTVECIGLFNEIRGQTSEIDFWTIQNEPYIDLIGNFIDHAHD